MKDYNNRANRIFISLMLSLPSYPLLHLIRNLPFSRITGYAFWQFGLSVFIGFFLIFEFQNWSSIFISKYLKWEQNLLKRLLYELGITLLITSVVVPASYAGLYIFVWDMGIFLPSIYLYVTIVYFIALCFMIFVNASPVITQWKSSLIKAEQMEKQSMNARLEALRTQLSPHFFFNNLSILNGLIDENPKQAKSFIARLSDVFRYILTHRNDEVVHLKQEIDFIRDYLFLLENRFREKIHYEIEIGDANDYLIPPVTLQQLVENAVKHNETSFENPLMIQIQISDNRLIVSNGWQKRKGLINSTGIGLESIRERFGLLTDEPIEIIESDGKFVVSLPLMKNEGFNNH